MSDFTKIAFSSAYRYEQIAINSSTPFSIVGGGFGTTTVTITHNLGYKPYYKAFYTFVDGKYFQLFAGTNSYDIDGNAVQVDNVYATTTTLVVEMSNYGAPAVSGTIYYRIYSEVQV